MRRLLSIFLLFTASCSSSLDSSSPMGAKSIGNAPKIDVRDDVKHIRFEGWQPMRGRNLFGQEGEWMVGEVLCEKDGTQSSDLATEQFDADGRKLSQGFVSFPPLRPGERGRAQFRLEDGAKKVIIRPSDSVLADLARREKERERAAQREAEARKAQAEALRAEVERQRLAEENERRRVEAAEEARRQKEKRQREAEQRRAAEELRRENERRIALEDVKAKRQLRDALSLLDRGFKKEAKKRLEAIVEKYQGTPSAETALQKLVELGD
jgi:hypothetical protein